MFRLKARGIDIMKELKFEELKLAYEQSVHRLFFLDYMGTLVERQGLTDYIDPDPVLNELIYQLTSDGSNQVVIISEKPREVVKNFFEHLPITFAAENGGWVRTKMNEWIAPLQQPPGWMGIVSGALEKLTTQYPGSFLEKLEFSVRWFYGTAWQTMSQSELNQFKSLLRMLHKGQDMQMVDQNGILTFSASGVSKGKFAAHLTAGQGAFDFILAAGDGVNDEDLFATVGDAYFTIKVGHQATSARYRVDNHEDFLKFLKGLAGLSKGSVSKKF
jgi:trehalose 6-phosphate synthase/phosphatase